MHDDTALQRSSPVGHLSVGMVHMQRHMHTQKAQQVAQHAVSSLGVVCGQLIG
jgi:hypothetical protein